jgi:hypothetical protein
MEGSSSDGGVIGNAGSDAGTGIGSPTCGTASAVSESFQGTVDELGRRWSNVDSARPVRITSGALSLAAASGDASGILSHERVMAAGSVVVGPIVRSGAGELEIALIGSGSAMAALRGDAAGALTLSRRDAAGNLEESLTGGATAAAYWRLAVDGGAVTASTSSDGEAFDEVARIEGGLDGDVAIRIQLTSDGSATEATIGELNPGTPARRCPLDALVDDFDSIDLERWRVVQTASCEMTAAGSLVIDHPSATGGCHLVSRRRYDLSRGSVSLDIAAAPPDGVPGVDVQLRFDDRSLIGVHIHDEPRMIKCRWISPAGYLITGDEIPYDPEAHRFWRLAPAVGVPAFTCEVSADRIDWQPLGTISVVPTGAVEIEIGTDEAGPGAATFDALGSR